MKLSKLLLIIIFATLFSLLYVWQQTEAFRLAYLGEKSQVVFQDLLDKNTILRYNIDRKASLSSIANKIYDDADFQMPDTYRLIRVKEETRYLAANKRIPKKEALLSRLFSIKRQAEAKTIGPAAATARIDGKRSRSTNY